MRRGLARSRADAVALITADRVTVGGAPATSGARLVGAGEAVTVRRPDTEYVSRGGHKLAGALDRFAVAVRDRRVLDAGASTGGFTDCVLQRGAREVVAVDVGHGQLAWSLREDPRVVVLERTNVRTLALEAIGEPVDVVVADLSFISLRSVADALVGLCRPDADLVLLVKPQFEAGRSRVGKGGVIRDEHVRRTVLHEVVAGLAEHRLGVVDVITSPITGADGNVEYLVHGRVDMPGLDPAGVDARLAAEGAPADPADVGKTGA